MVYSQFSVVPTLPSAIEDYVVSVMLADRAAAYFKVTSAGHILDWGGAVGDYGIQAIESGQPITQHLFFIDALLPLQDEAEQLFCVKFNGDHPVDVHLFSTTQTAQTERQDYWVLLLDATHTEAQQLRLQQKSNEFNLLRQRYAKLLQSDIRHRLEVITADPASPSLQSDISCLRAPALDSVQAPHYSSILVVKCNLDTPSGPDTTLSPQQWAQQPSPPSSDSLSHHLLKQLNRYLAIITQIVGQEGGLIHHVFGDTAVALFGLLPACQSPSEQAAYAARKILLKCRDFAEEKQGEKRTETVSEAPASTEQFNVGVAITTSQSTAGVIHSQGYRAVHTLGDHVERALCLSQWICPGVILIDGQTFDQLEHEKQRFDASLLVSKHNPIRGKTFYAQELYPW